MLEQILLWMVYFSWSYWILACFLVRGHFRGQYREGDGFTFIRASRLGRETPDRRQATPSNPELLPPVSVLKPVCGLDYQAYENFVSFCRQDYPEYEIILGVESLSDPVVEVINRIRDEFSDRRIRLVVGRSFAANRKACLLHYMVSQARYETLVISDSDIRVTPDYLRRVVTSMRQARGSFVTCPYKGGAALSVPAKMEALHMGTVFLPSAVVAWRLGVPFALGATVALRRSDLESMGGFKAIASYLADDFQLGYRMASLGVRPVLSDYVTTSVLGSTVLLEEWHREVRWAKCNRLSRPAEYPGVLLTFSTPLAGILALLRGFTSETREILLLSLAIRYVTSWFITGYTGDKETRRFLYLLPFREILSILVWVSGLFGRRIVWRGREYILEEQGRMRAVGEA